MYAHPVYLPTKTYFYAIGNTPAVDLLEHLPLEENGRALLLGCGDPRSILHTVYSRVASNVGRQLDATCCDVEPGVVARNILLLSLIVEEGINITQLWCIFYHIYIDEDALSLLVLQSRKLAEASKDLASWEASPFAQFMKLCTADTCYRLNKFWGKYAEIGSRNSKERATAKAKFAIEMRKQRKFDSFDTTMRTAGLWFVEMMPMGLKHFKAFWDTGLTTIGSASTATNVNPTFAFTSAGEQCSVHHGSDPILGFHLAPALAPLLSRSDTPPTADKIKLHDIDQCAFEEFQDWCEAFRRAKARIVVRFFIGDALCFCYALQAKSQGIHLEMTPFVSPWTSRRIVLNPNDYNDSAIRRAPSCFDAIDTSNLADHLGMLNVLPATVPLLEDNPLSSLYTDTLLPAGATSQGSLEHRLCGDIEIMSLLLGVTPTAYSSGFTTTSRVNEHLFNSTMPADQKLPRETFVWKLCSTAFGEAPSLPSFDPGELAQFFHQVFLKMFVSEGTEHVRSIGKQDSQQSRLLSEMNLKHYTRRSFVILLHFIRNRFVTDWDGFMHILLNRIETERSLVLGSNFFQDLYIWLHSTGLHHFDPLVTNQVAVPPKDQNKGRFRGWKEIPGLVCVLLVVPRQRLKVLTDMSPDEIGTPVLQVDLKLPYAHNMFASYQICYGRCRVVKNEVAPEEDLVEIEEDELGLKGASDAIVSVWMPSWILRQEVRDVRIGLSIHPSPAASVKLVPKLGVYLSIFEANVMDKEHIHILRERPGFHDELIMVARLPAPRKAFTEAKVSNARQNQFGLDISCQRISLLKSRIDVTKPDAKESLAGGAAVSVLQVSNSTVDVKFGGFAFRVDFELPVDGTSAKLRIARKSSYIEASRPYIMTKHVYTADTLLPISKVLASPIRSDLPEHRFFDPAPILTPKACSPVLQYIHYLDLDNLPALDTTHGPTRLYLLRAHMAGTFSERERISRDKPQEQRDVLCNVKDTIASILLIASNVQEANSKIFALDMPPDVGIYTLIFVEEVRIDLPSNTVVADAYILPLTADVMSNILDELRDISADGRVIRIATYKEEVVAWKRLLPAFVERCRKWQHSALCKYREVGKIPVSVEAAETPICSCGTGKDLGKFAERTKWKHIVPFVTRAAISPLFAPGFLEEIGSPLGADMDDGESDNSRCAACGGPGKPKLLRCARCKKVSYCSSVCQKAAWKKHKSVCKEVK